MFGLARIKIDPETLMCAGVSFETRETPAELAVVILGEAHEMFTPKQVWWKADRIDDTDEERFSIYDSTNRIEYVIPPEVSQLLEGLLVRYKMTH